MGPEQSSRYGGAGGCCRPSFRPPPLPAQTRNPGKSIPTPQFVLKHVIFLHWPQGGHVTKPVFFARLILIGGTHFFPYLCADFITYSCNAKSVEKYRQPKFSSETRDFFLHQPQGKHATKPVFFARLILTRGTHFFTYLCAGLKGYSCNVIPGYSSRAAMAAVRAAMWARRSAAVIAKKSTTVAWGMGGAGA